MELLFCVDGRIELFSLSMEEVEGFLILLGGVVISMEGRACEHKETNTYVFVQKKYVFVLSFNLLTKGFPYVESWK